MAGDNPNRPKRFNLIDGVNPGLNTGLCSIESKKTAVHQNIAGKQDSVALDEDERVAVGVRPAIPEQSHTNASQIESLLGIENLIGLAELCILHQIGHRG